MQDGDRFQDGRSPSKWILPLSILGSSLGFIDSSVVNIALPEIQARLSMSLADAQWVTNGYLLSLASLVLLGGAAGDRWGTMRVFLWGLLAFTLSSALCALSSSAPVLVTYRIAQGASAAFLMPASLALLSQNYQGEMRAKAIGIWAASGGVLMALGPPLGGWLVSSWGWPSIFLINLPLAAAALVLTFLTRRVRKLSNKRKIDITGAFLVVCALASMTYGLIEIGKGEITRGVVALAWSVPLSGAFILHEGRVISPMVPLSMFKNARFSGLNILTVLLYGALGAAIFLLPFAMTKIHGYSATRAGVAFMPLSLTFGVGSCFAGRLTSWVGSRTLLLTGPSIMAMGFVALAASVNVESYTIAFLPGLLLIAIGLTAVVPALTTAIFDTISPAESGTASGINNAAARTGGLLATATIGMAFGGDNNITSTNLSTAYSLVMLAAAALAFCSAVVAKICVPDHIYGK